MFPSAFLALVDEAMGPGAHVVGGAVRDRLIDRETYDLDVSVPGDAARAADRLAAATGGRAFPLHAELGILRVVTDHGNVDVARFQGRTLDDDIDRRDFTINALAVPLAAWRGRAWRMAIVDRHGGVADIRRKVLSPVSKKIFTEDPLRLLRAFRIGAELGFTLSPAALALIRKHKALARKPAAERLREEMLKTFSTPRAHAALALMDKAGVLDVIFPNAKPLRKTAPRYYGKGGVLKHTLDSVRLFEDVEASLRSWFPRSATKIKAYLAAPTSGYSMSAHCKWALLLHDIGKPKTAKMIDGRLRFFEHEHVGADMVEKLSAIFRWSSDEQSRYARLVRHHMRPGNLAMHPEAGDKAYHRFFRDLAGDAVAMLLVSLADHLTYLTPAQLKKRSSAHELTTIKMISRFYSQTSRVLPERILTGHDIMKALSLKPSPIIGRLLTESIEAQVEGKVRNKQEAIEHLRGILPKLEAEAKKP